MSSEDIKSIKKSPIIKNDVFLDKSLRPETWVEYIGQETIKNNVKILLQAAKNRNHRPEHLLFYGPPGLGKTTLAHLIAKELNSQIKATSGPAIEKVSDLASILTNLETGDILFIDEIHRLNKMIEEVLYPAMEQGSLNIIIGKGPGARVIQLDLPPFTLIAATTRIALLSSPLRSRFSGGTHRLQFYSESEISSIIKRSAGLLGNEIDDGAIEEIAKRSRFTPRFANQLLKRARDYAEVHELPLTRQVVIDALLMFGIDKLGLTEADRSVLINLAEKFAGGPVGLNTLATSLMEEEATLEEVYEPYLIQCGLIERTKQGRKLTKKGYHHLKQSK